MPRPVVALPWGSRPTRRVERSARASPAARFTAVVVLPTPPFWLTTAMVLGMWRSYNTGGVPRFTQVADVFHDSHVRFTVDGKAAGSAARGDLQPPSHGQPDRGRA